MSLVIEKTIERAKRYKNKYKRTKFNQLSHKLADEIIIDPEKSPWQIAKDLDEKYPTVIREFRFSNISKPDYRREWVVLCNEFSETLFEKSIEEGKQWMKNRKKLLIKWNRGNLTSIILWKIVMNKAISLKVDPMILEQMKNTESYIGLKISRDLIYLYDDYVNGVDISVGIGMAEYKQRLEQLVNIAPLQVDIIELIKTWENLDRTQLIDTLIDLTQSFNLISEEIQTLSDQFQDIQSQMESKMKLNLFQRMNSSEYGYILDTLYQILLLKENNKNEDNDQIISFLKMFQRFLGHEGIKPLYLKSKIYKFTKSDLGKADYIGSEITNRDDVKMVTVKSPGWTYRKQLISKASLMEVEE